MIQEFLDLMGLSPKFAILGTGIILSMFLTVIFAYFPKLNATTKNIIVIVSGSVISMLSINLKFGNLAETQSTLLDFIFTVAICMAFYTFIGKYTIKKYLVKNKDKFTGEMK